jgi:chromosome segregation ATPase
MRLLRAELKTLEQAEARLVASQNTAKERSAATRTAIRGLEKDLTSWERDVTEATKLREDFQRQLEATRGLQRETEGRIVALGRELRDVAAKLTAEIDRVAPPPRTSRAVSVGADQP